MTTGWFGGPPWLRRPPWLEQWPSPSIWCLEVPNFDAELPDISMSSLEASCRKPISPTGSGVVLLLAGAWEDSRCGQLFGVPWEVCSIFTQPTPLWEALRSQTDREKNRLRIFPRWSQLTQRTRPAGGRGSVDVIVWVSAWESRISPDWSWLICFKFFQVL